MLSAFLSTLALLPLSLLCFLSTPTPAGGQNFTVPSGWSKPTSTLTRDERQTIAQDTLATLAGLIDPAAATVDGLGVNQAASVIAALALYDTYANSTANYNTASDNIRNFGQLHERYYGDPYVINSDNILWGLTAYYTYRAYKEQFLLDIAASIWNTVLQYMITSDQAAAGNQTQRSVSFPSTCNGTTNAGAVFWQAGVLNDTGTNGETMGPFLTLSAYLFEATSDSKYSDAAELAATFIQNHLYNGTIIEDAFSVGPCTGSGATVDALSYNSGFAIEGLSVWANVSKSDTWTALTRNLVAATIPFGVWTDSDGVNIEISPSPDNKNIAEDSFPSGLKSFFIRGLHEAWARTGDPSSDMAEYIAAYITVQFNSIQDLALSPGSTNYSLNWNGPPVTAFSPWGAAVALDVLNPAFNIAPAATPTFAAPSSSSSSSSLGSSSHSAAAAIAGGVVGGLAGVAVVGLFAFFLLRRRRRNRYSGPVLDMTTMHEGDRSTVVEPFVYQQASQSPSSDASVTLLSSKKRMYSSSRPGHVRAETSISQGPLSTGLRPEDSISNVNSAAHPEDNDPSAIPILVQRLNGMLARFQNAQHGDEAPPTYEG